MRNVYPFLILLILTSCFNRSDPPADVEYNDENYSEDAEINENLYKKPRVIMESKDIHDEKLPFVSMDEKIDLTPKNNDVTDVPHIKQNDAKVDANPYVLKDEEIKETPKLAPETPKSLPYFIKPVQARILDQFHSVKPQLKNEYMSFDTKVNQEVVASQDGIVKDAGQLLPGMGKMVILQHKNKTVSVYMMLSKVQVSKGDKIHQMDVLGSTSDKPMRLIIKQKIGKNWKAINPVTLMK